MMLATNRAAVSGAEFSAHESVAAEKDLYELPRLQLHGVPGHQRVRPFQEFRHGARSQVALAANANANRIRLCLLVADDEDERHLLQPKVADLSLHLAVRGVEFHAKPCGFK